MTPWSDYVDRFGLGIKEAKLFALLSDGQPHADSECLSHGLGKVSASEQLVAVCVSRIRKKVEPHGYRISRKRGVYTLVPPAPVPLSQRRKAA